MNNMGTYNMETFMKCLAVAAEQTMPDKYNLYNKQDCDPELVRPIELIK